MNPATGRDVLAAMEMKGGSFASHLAIAAMYADDENLARIKIAFAELWATYRRMAEAEKAQGVQP